MDLWIGPLGFRLREAYFLVVLQVAFDEPRKEMGCSYSTTDEVRLTLSLLDLRIYTLLVNASGKCTSSHSYDICLVETLLLLNALATCRHVL